MTLDFTVLGPRMVGDPRGPLTHEHFGQREIENRWNSTQEADRRNQRSSRPATDLEIALLRHLDLIGDDVGTVRADIEWRGPIRRLTFTSTARKPAP